MHLGVLRPMLRCFAIQTSVEAHFAGVETNLGGPFLTF